MRMTLKLALVAAAMTSFLAFMLVSHASARASGQTVILEAQGYDPRDILMGHFATLRTDLHQLDITELDPQSAIEGERMVYVSLAPGTASTPGGDAVWQAVAIAHDRPRDGTYIRGIADWISADGRAWDVSPLGDDAADPDAEPSASPRRIMNARYNIERYYASRDRALDLEDRLLRRGENAGPIYIILSLPPSGDAIIKGFIIEGERIEDSLWD